MSVTPNFCCDETKNRGAYTRVTVQSTVDQQSCPSSRLTRAVSIPVTVIAINKTLSHLYHLMLILIIILTIDIILFSTDEECREQRAYRRQSQHAISNLPLEITIQKPQGSMLSEFLLKQNCKAERCQKGQHYCCPLFLR